MPQTLKLVFLLLCGACSPSSQDAAPVSDSAATPVVSAIPELPTFAPAAPDSGPPVRIERHDGQVRVVMDPAAGDQINALQPPVIETANGQRLLFAGSAVTKDSAYFVGDVVLALEPTQLPLSGTLTTSYCRKGENLCRSAKRLVAVPQ